MIHWRLNCHLKLNRFSISSLPSVWSISCWNLLSHSFAHEYDPHAKTITWFNLFIASGFHLGNRVTTSFTLWIAESFHIWKFWGHSWLSHHWSRRDFQVITIDNAQGKLLLHVFCTSLWSPNRARWMTWESLTMRHLQIIYSVFRYLPYQPADFLAMLF